jgi:hypothetical protein
LGEAFDRAGVHSLLAEVLAGDVDLCLLARTADGDVGVLLVGLPAAGEDAACLGGEPLALVDVYGVGEADVGELARVEVHFAWFAFPGLDRDAVLVAPPPPAKPASKPKAKPKKCVKGKKLSHNKCVTVKAKAKRKKSGKRK